MKCLLQELNLETPQSSNYYKISRLTLFKKQSAQVIQTLHLAIVLLVYYFFRLALIIN